MKVAITGIAGVLGSSLAELCLDKGFEVVGNDVQRIEEAWKLGEFRDRIDYQWKSSTDLDPRDLKGTDVILDCGIGFPDRPFGTDSPRTTFVDNVQPVLGVLEAVRRMEDKPVVIYASSFNVFYGEPGMNISEDSKLSPSSVYGWSKASAELLYQTYQKAYGIPTVVTRVGSAFGPKGRSDELVHNLIIHALKGEDFHLRSPKAQRLWCYSRDVLHFYEKLLESLDDFVGETLHCAGNREDEIINNFNLAYRVKKLTDSSMEIESGEYEPGELINGRPVSFTFDSSRSQELTGWTPEYSLNNGLKETIKWFEENLWRYNNEDKMCL